MAKVLVACEFSGIVRDAFLDRGHDAWSCDLLPSETRSNRHIQGDVRGILLDGRDCMIVAHPPCTRLCNSGVRWLSRAVPVQVRSHCRARSLELAIDRVRGSVMLGNQSIVFPIGQALAFSIQFSFKVPKAHQQVPQKCLCYLYNLFFIKRCFEITISNLTNRIREAASQGQPCFNAVPNRCGNVDQCGVYLLVNYDTKVTNIFDLLHINDIGLEAFSDPAHKQVNLALCFEVQSKFAFHCCELDLIFEKLKSWQSYCNCSHCSHPSAKCPNPFTGAGGGCFGESTCCCKLAKSHVAIELITHEEHQKDCRACAEAEGKYVRRLGHGLVLSLRHFDQTRQEIWINVVARWRAVIWFEHGGKDHFFLFVGERAFCCNLGVNQCQRSPISGVVSKLKALHEYATKMLKKPNCKDCGHRNEKWGEPRKASQHVSCAYKFWDIEGSLLEKIAIDETEEENGYCNSGCQECYETNCRYDVTMYFAFSPALRCWVELVFDRELIDRSVHPFNCVIVRSVMTLFRNVQLGDGALRCNDYVVCLKGGFSLVSANLLKKCSAVACEICQQLVLHLNDFSAFGLLYVIACNFLYFIWMRFDVVSVVESDNNKECNNFAFYADTFTFNKSPYWGVRYEDGLTFYEFSKSSDAINSVIFKFGSNIEQGVKLASNDEFKNPMRVIGIFCVFNIEFLTNLTDAFPVVFNFFLYFVFVDCRVYCCSGALQSKSVSGLPVFGEPSRLRRIIGLTTVDRHENFLHTTRYQRLTICDYQRLKFDGLKVNSSVLILPMISRFGPHGRFLATRPYLESLAEGRCDG